MLHCAGAVLDNTTGDVAVDQYHRYKVCVCALSLSLKSLTFGLFLGVLSHSSCPNTVERLEATV